MPVGRPGGRQFTIYTDLTSGILFFAVGVALLLLLPGQVMVAKNDVVDGRVFPRLLILLMLLCSAGLIVKDLVKALRHEPLATKTVHLDVEMRAAAIFAILVATYLICNLTGLFVIGACFCCLAFLLFFGCRKKSYYAITLAFAVLVWASFRFILNVNF